MNKAIEAAAKSRSILTWGLIEHMTNERLEEMLNALWQEVSRRGIEITIATEEEAA